MPHCILEAAQPVLDHIDAETLVNVVHGAALESALFGPEDIKTRLLPYAHYQVGSKAMTFIHVTFHILSGRSPEQKRALTQLTLNKLSGLGLSDVSLTVDVKDTVRETYAKAVV